MERLSESEKEEGLGTFKCRLGESVKTVHAKTIVFCRFFAYANSPFGTRRCWKLPKIYIKYNNYKVVILLR